MPLQKQAIPINFSQGLDLKSDPKQVQAGKFLSLQNSVFTKYGQLAKRNGFAQISSLANTSFKSLTTFNGNLMAIGSSISAYNPGTASWVSKGSIQPLDLSTLPLIRNSLNQSQCDAVIAPNGLVCTAYTEVDGAASTIKYAIADSLTGQNVVAPTALQVTTSGSSPRVFVLGAFFIIMYTNLVSSTPHLQYIAVSWSNPSSSTTPQDIAASYASNSGVSWDGVVVGSNLYIAYNTTTGGQAIKVTYLTASQASVVGSTPVSPISFAGYKADIMSVCADTTSTINPTVYICFSSAASGSFVFAVSGSSLTPVTTTSVFSSGASSITVASASGLSIGQVISDSTTSSNIVTGTQITSISGTTIGLSVPTAGNSASTPGDTLAVTSSALNIVMSPVSISSNGNLAVNITSVAQNGTCTIYSELSNTYAFPLATLPTNYIIYESVTPLGFNFNSVFSSGASSITAGSARGLVTGMRLLDNTTPSNITIDTSITVSGTTLPTQQ